MRLLKLVVYLSFLATVSLYAQNKPSTTYLKAASVTETAGKVQVKAVSPRPLAQVLDALLDKYGWVVDYEDPQFTSASDTVEVQGATGLAKYPSGGAFSFEFSSAPPQEEKVLQQAVDAYSKTDNPGRFELHKNPDGHFDVVGTSARDDKGSMAKQQVLLDTVLNAPTEEHSITEVLNQLCDGLTSETHVPVVIGISPRSLLDHNKVKLAVGKASARDLLRQSLQATHHNLYWRLLFDPNSKTYFLDIHSPRTP